MLQESDVLKAAFSLGADHACVVDPSQIRCYPELRASCEMNQCGCYANNWGCPPGCGTVEELSRLLSTFSHGVVFQAVAPLQDSFDLEGMMAATQAFQQVSRALRRWMADHTSRFLVLGAGKCQECDSCTYPGAPCRNPLRKNISVEACGILVSELCSLAALPYSHGSSSVTHTGLILF